MRIAGLVALLLAVAGCPSSQRTPGHDVRDAASDAPVADRTDWHGRSIYFVMTDRFANGDPANDNANGYAADLADPRAWHGGDVRGLIDRLDYIAGMGFTGLWITPVIEQHDGHGYHGYWGWDWSKIDGHLGDLDQLRALVAAAHQRGIAVMIDTVANHTGRYNYATPTFPDYAMYHHNGNITDYGNPTQVENNDLSGLNDLAQDNPAVAAKLLDHVRWLVTETGADGLRVDTVKHVPKPFWSEWVGAARVFTLGEVLDGAVDNVAPYSHVLDATLDYPLYFAIKDVFAKNGSMRRLGDVLGRDTAYRDPQLSGVFLDNHDQPRFLCEATGATDADKLAQLRLALAFVFTTRGIPVVYYGTEQAFASCSENRPDMFGTPSTASAMYLWIATLQRIRTRSEALRTGVQHERWQDDTAYAFERVAGAHGAVVAFNLGGGPRTLSLQGLVLPTGTTLRDALGGGGTVTVDAGRVQVTIPARAVVVLTTEP